MVARNYLLTTLPETLFMQIILVLGLIICGMIVFGSMGQLTGAFNLTQLRQALRR